VLLARRLCLWQAGTRSHPPHRVASRLIARVTYIFLIIFHTSRLTFDSTRENRHLCQSNDRSKLRILRVNIFGVWMKANRLAGLQVSLPQQGCVPSPPLPALESEKRAAALWHHSPTSPLLGALPRYDNFILSASQAVYKSGRNGTERSGVAIFCCIALTYRCCCQPRNNKLFSFFASRWVFKDGWMSCRDRWTQSGISYPNFNTRFLIASTW